MFTPKGKSLGNKSLSQSALQRFGVSLACSVVISAFCVPQTFAQMGPMPPQPKQQPENQVTKALVKFLNKNKKDGNSQTDPASASAADDTKGDAKSDAKGRKPTVIVPDDASAQSAPGNAPQQADDRKRPPLLTQPPLTTAKIDDPQIDSANPPILDHPKLDDPNNPLGFTDAENKLKHYMTLLDGHRYDEAKPGLTHLRQWLVDLTEAHIGLYKTLNQVPSARGQAELEKELALEFAQLRDRSMLEMARIYIAEKDYSHAVKELTDVVKSQPRSKVGLNSYALLQEIGFTEKLQLTQ
jgi:hypothetical protein